MLLECTFVRSKIFASCNSVVFTTEEDNPGVRLMPMFATFHLSREKIIYCFKHEIFLSILQNSDCRSKRCTKTHPSMPYLIVELNRNRQPVTMYLQFEFGWEQMFQFQSTVHGTVASTFSFSTVSLWQGVGASLAFILTVEELDQNHWKLYWKFKTNCNALWLDLISMTISEMRQFFLLVLAEKAWAFQIIPETTGSRFAPGASQARGADGTHFEVQTWPEADIYFWKPI